MNDLEIQKKIDAIENEKGPHTLKRTYRYDIHHKNRTAKDVENLVISCSVSVC
jgi:hypothetical protein